MKKGLRVGLQIILWATIWIVMALGHIDILSFLKQNWIIFLIQVIIIIIITIYVSFNISIKKKPSHFILIGFITLLLCAAFAYQFSEPLKEPRKNHPPEIEQQHLPQQGDHFLPPPEHLGDRNQLSNDNPQKRRGFTKFGQVLRSPFLINFLILLITVSFTVIIEIILYARRKEKALIHSKTQNLETELKLLKSQINPHFLFNALNNIYALSAIDASKTQQSIMHLSNMLRYVLYECERPYVTLSKEVDYIKNYITLYRLKSSKKYPIDMQLNISNNTLEIAPMLLIPFVENAFKHSNIENIDNTFLKINLTSTDKTITFKVQNTFEKGVVKKDKVGGIGIENVKKRLDILYPSNHKLEISQDNTTFNTLLEINIDV